MNIELAQQIANQYGLSARQAREILDQIVGACIIQIGEQLEADRDDTSWQFRHGMTNAAAVLEQTFEVYV